MDEPLAPPEPSRWRLTARIAVVAVLGALVGLLLWATLIHTRGQSLPARIAAGEKPAAPHFELEVIWPEGRTGTLALEDLRGRPAVLNFWASWCIPCRDEAPILDASSRAHAGEVQFVGVDVQDLRSDALAFLREFDVPYVSVRDGTNKTYEAYGLTGVPETYYLDAEGRIVAHAPGAVSADTLEEGIAQAIEGRPSGP